MIDTSLSSCRSDARTLSRSRIRSKDSGARPARGGMRTECLAFGVPIHHRAGNTRLALGCGGYGPPRSAEESRVLAGDNHDCSGRDMGRSCRAPPRYGPPCATNRKTCPREVNEPQMEPYVDRWVPICHSRFSDQNSRYGMFRPWCAVRGPPTPHPVPCGLNTFSKTQSTPPPISPPTNISCSPQISAKPSLCPPYGPFRLSNDLPLPPIQLQTPRGQAGGLPPSIGSLHQREQPPEPFSGQLRL